MLSLGVFPGNETHDICGAHAMRYQWSYRNKSNDDAYAHRLCTYIMRILDRFIQFYSKLQWIGL